MNPCPFCGRSNVRVERLQTCVYCIVCDECGAHGPPTERAEYEWGEGEPEIRAAQAWNRRKVAR